MNKAKRGRKFGRTRKKRLALLRSLAQALILHEKITTTEPKARELRIYMEKTITRSRKGGLSARRFAAVNFGDERAAKKLVGEIAPRYNKRQGGYTRIVKREPRKTDSARMATIEFV